MNAVVAERLSKSYRRSARRRGVGSLKSAVLHAFRGGPPAADAVFPALSDVSFTIAAGETVGVVGENGSGKSTLLKVLAGIHVPTSGRLETRGRIAALIELGAGFHPEISARENVEINGMLLGLSRKEIAARLDAIVAFADVERFLDEPVKTFSSGMVVRLGFAIAAHADPEILLVDEVLSVGDEQFTHRCLERIAEFQREGRTIVVVSHDLELVIATAPRALRLSGGRLVADASAAEVVGRYREEVAFREGEARTAGAGGEGKRWGSGAARIESVRLVGGDGRVAGVLTAGQPFRIEIAGRAAAPISDFVAGLRISRIDGTTVFGTNTRIDGHRAETVEGEFRIAVEFPAADLTAGTYAIDAAVHASDGAPYDYRADVLRFDVFAPEPTAGVWRAAHRWDLSEAGRWTK
ncbi:MAG TPA: ABC transporter ATP-binding protein [Thermoanaerobaculia bacterium]|nr:ABC transporter ATP-binding protein [Thermoanaerobaculia bacterium]